MSSSNLSKHQNRRPSSTSLKFNQRSVSSRDDTPPPTKKAKTKPLMSLARPPIFDLTGLEPSPPPKTAKSKGKEREILSQRVASFQHEGSALWIDLFEPTAEEELAVHKRKVQDVRQWLLEAFDGGPSGKLSKYRRILALTGPAGTAKTATVRVLARELDFEIAEWSNTMDEQFSRTEGTWDTDYEGLSEKFQTFLTRASNCQNIFSRPPTQTNTSSQRSTTAVPSTTASTSTSRRKVVLVEDLPNILHPRTQESFHATLESFVASTASVGVPLVIVVSDAGVRGEDAEADGPRRWSRGKEAVDVRTVLPPSLLSSPAVRQINFNPIAATYMRTALKSLLDRQRAVGVRPSKDVLDLIVESSNGDIRSAIMALQFACTADGSALPLSKGNKRSAKGKGPSAATVLQAVTRREQSLALFHLLGKIMYNKRKGDPPTQSAPAKDVKRDKELDARLKDPPLLPPHFSEHDRRASRVDIEELYADSPIDASLLSLYIHQNYTQYCDTLDQCEALADMLSWVDSSGGEAWHQANPHHFHLVALGTLHALPSPVPRRNQKPFKPAFFESLRRQRAAEEGVQSVQAWLQRAGGMPSAKWAQREVALGAGTVLRLADGSARVPPAHRAFSRLDFHQQPASQSAELAEEGDVGDEVEVEPDSQRRVAPSPAVEADVSTGRCLSDDDIEEW
ncbi:Rad17-domain-containing protein [Epithele typhae]|uniref:Rad17-domain-containing protein n=1 Tax=Epithele typhae TaxID=378194 RepID=UPI00200753CA|nr:Rad17-domain-containing protein [Epithele typhae]KAH9914163.1 Rad17-domain-containing protein [Epithele typhae]